MRTLTIPVAALLLIAGCATAGLDPDTAARIARIEERVADLERQRGQPATAAPGGAEERAATEEKAAFAAAAGPSRVSEQLQDVDAVAGVDEVRFEEATDTLVVQLSSTGDDLEAAWTAAQGLSTLWRDLDSFQPVLDLKVGEVRCACSSKLMKDVASGVADRAAWEVACDV